MKLPFKAGNAIPPAALGVRHGGRVEPHPQAMLTSTPPWQDLTQALEKLDYPLSDRPEHDQKVRAATA